MLSVTPTESAESVFFVMSVAVVVVEAPVAVPMTVLTPEPSKPPTLMAMVTPEMRVVMRALLFSASFSLRIYNTKTPNPCTKILILLEYTFPFFHAIQKITYFKFITSR